MNEQLLDEVWRRGIPVEGCDPAKIRKDCCGAFLLRSAYGNRYSDFGWEVDHILPQSRGGDDNLRNLRPMQWRNNLSKGDSYPDYESVVTSSDNSNVDSLVIRSVNADIQKELSALYGL